MPAVIDLTDRPAMTRLTRQLPALGPVNTAAAVWELYHRDPVVDLDAIEQAFGAKETVRG